MLRLSHTTREYDSLPSSDQREELLSQLRGWERRVDEPVETDPETYDRALEAFVAATVDHPDVVAVYGDSSTPTVPGISDLDLAVVVEDRAERLSELQTDVDAVLEEYASLFSHGPILLPESVFEGVPLVANNTTSLDHLGGRSLETRDPGEIALTLRFFDRLAFRPYGYLVRDLFPELDGTATSTNRRGLLREAERAVRPTIGSLVRRYEPCSERLYLKKSRILSKAGSVKHDRDLFEAAFGSTPDVDDEFLDRVEACRRDYFEDPVTDEECLELLLDGVSYRYRLYLAFLERQRAYAETDRTVYLRRSAPTLATPAWNEVTPYWQLKRFYESGIRGRVLPPAAAAHIATLPGCDDLFYGSAPEPEFVDEEVARVAEQRNETLRLYFEFLERHDGVRDTFKLVPTAGFVVDATSRPHSAVTGLAAVKERVRDVRNVLVASRWHRAMRAQRGRPVDHEELAKRRRPRTDRLAVEHVGDND